PPAVSDEDAIPDDALEFDPATTDASSVFVEPPPSPEWSAATGTFKAMMAANQEAVQPQEPRPAKREQSPAGRPPEAAHPPPPPPAPRAPSATVRPLRSRPGDRPKAPPTPSARSAPPTPPSAATALTPVESEAPPAPYRRVLRIVRPPKGEWLVSVAWGAGAV